MSGLEEEDEHRQVTGAETFNILQARINNLDKELRNFSNAARLLESSAATLSSAYHLREQMAQMLALYQENAADLFPRKIPRPNKRFTARRHQNAQGKKYFKILPGDVDLEEIPQTFETIANNIVTFSRCLNDFPEFTDEAINASIMSFEGDFRYWASCLQVYRGQFRYSIRLFSDTYMPWQEG